MNLNFREWRNLGYTRTCIHAIMRKGTREDEDMRECGYIHQYVHVFWCNRLFASVLERLSACMFPRFSVSTLIRLFAYSLILLLLLPLTTMADEFRLVPSVAAKQEYNDNIYLDPKGGNAPTHDWISTFTPKLEMIKNTEILGMSCRAE